MKPLFVGLCATALLSLLSPLTPVLAQTRALGTRPAAPYYDVAREVSLKGTVSSVLPNASRGMIPGAHLLLTTSSGAVDASLGRFGLRGKGALSVSTGEQVEVTGVTTTRRGAPVFVVRTLKVRGQLYAMRNEHGIAVPPQSRERVGRKAAQFGRGI